MKHRIRRTDWKHIARLLGMLPAVLMVCTLAVLTVADLLDGKTSFPWGRPVFANVEPWLFAVSVGVTTLVCAMASILYLTFVSIWRENWLPGGLRGKPWMELTIMSMLTGGSYMFATELFSGEAKLLRHNIQVTSEHDPLAFAFIAVLFLCASPLLIAGWYFVWRSWKRPTWSGIETRQAKPEFEDISKRAKI